MIFNLQILRGIAATAVAFYHTAFLLPGGLHSDFFGVSTFFVISGFIMCLITRQDSERFLVKRLIRIVPMYWLCTIALVVLTCKLPAELIRGDLPGDLLHGLFFIPYRNAPVLGVGWTLNYEIYFYLVFAAALLISPRWAPPISAVAILAVVAAGTLFPGNFLLDYYAHSYVKYFAAGIALFYLYVYVPRLRTTLATIVCGGLVLVAYGSQFTFPLWREDWFGRGVEVFPVVVVAAALLAEKSGAAITARPLILLGDASYCLYLVHPIVYKIAQSRTRFQDWPSAEDHLAVAMAWVAASIVVAVLLHIFIERPILVWLRRRLASPSASALATEGA